MVSFKVLDDTNREEIISELSVLLTEDARGGNGNIEECDLDAAYEIIEGFELSYDIEYALTVSHGCLLVRIFDMGRYLFLYPFEIFPSASADFAVLAIAEYARRQEIPLVFSDVPSEALLSFVGFRHIDIDAEDFDCASYRVTVKTECQLIDEIPEIVCGRVKLNAISDLDTERYARLCKNDAVNEYWGYNYADDVENPSDAYFLETARLDFSRGAALSLAIRESGREELIGEAIIYAFDGRGGAEFAVRLLPEEQGRGLGRASVNAVVELASSIGLIRLYARVKNENAPSHAMLSGVLDVVDATESDKYYEIAL